MSTATLAIGLVILMAAVASAYAHAAQRQRRKADANARRIAHAVTEYFTRSGAQVSAKCHHVHGHFLVLVESEPLKRFRYSHIVEATLISHVDKALGLKVDRVFWRFPLPVGASSPQDTADIKPTQREDDYLAEGIREAKTSPEYHVSEDSWEQFEKAQSVEGATPSAPARTDKAGPAQ